MRGGEGRGGEGGRMEMSGEGRREKDKKRRDNTHDRLLLQFWKRRTPLNRSTFLS